MVSSKEVIQKTKTTYGSYGRTKTKTYGTYGSDKYDEVVDNFPNLYDEQNRTLRIWQARRIGTDKYYQLARQAENGKYPARLFTYLLKKA